VKGERHRLYRPTAAERGRGAQGRSATILRAIAAFALLTAGAARSEAHRSPSTSLPGPEAQGASAPPPPSSASALPGLGRGEVVVEMREIAESGPKEGVARGVIDAPPDQVFRALVDYAHWSEFMPFLQKSDARPLSDGAVESHQVMTFPNPMGGRRYTVRFTSRTGETPSGRVWRVDWMSVPGSGNVKVHRGSWVLLLFGPGRTFATCSLFTDPGDLTPDFAMNLATRKMLVWIFKGLRQQVNRGRYLEGGG